MGEAHEYIRHKYDEMEYGHKHGGAAGREATQGREGRAARAHESKSSRASSSAISQVSLSMDK